MKLTPLQKRAARKQRNQTGLDMNLVSLIDVFTILIFFLLAHSGSVEILASPKSVVLPESVADTQPRPTVVVVVSASEILVDGRKVASVDEVLRNDADVIVPLKAELEQLQAGKQLTIMGDKDIPYRLLRKIMVTGSQAQFSDVSFAVRQREAS